MFRVSSSSFYSSISADLNARQRELQHLNAQMTSGKRIVTAADDPVGAANAADLRSSLSRLDQFKQNQSYAQHILSLGETALTSAIDAASAARDSLMAAGNGAYTDADRANLADQLQSVLDRMVGVANSSDGEGGYLFAGGRDGATPFGQLGGQVSYRGGALGQTIEIASGRFLPVKFAGDALFGGMRPGNGSFVTAAAATNTGGASIDAGAVTQPAALTGSNYEVRIVDNAGTKSYQVYKDGAVLGTPQEYKSPATLDIDGMRIKLEGESAVGDSFSLTPASAQSVFDTLGQAVELLRTPIDGDPAARAQYNSKLAGLIASVDGAIAHFQSTRSDMGAGLSELESYASLNDDRILQQKTRLSSIEDLDYASAATQVAANTLASQAAMQSYSMVSRLSLFNYL